MRRWITTVAMVVAVLLAFEGVARFLEPRLPEPDTWSNPFLQAKYGQITGFVEDGGIDVVVLGSSIANAGVDAASLGEDLGVVAYNAGLPSSTMEIWAGFAQDAIFARTCPDVVVVAVNIRDANANSPGLPIRLRNYERSEGRLDAVNPAPTITTDPLGWVEDRAQEVSAFIRIRPRLREPGHVRDWVRRGRAFGWSEPLEDLDAHGRYLRFGNRPFTGEVQLEDLTDNVFADFETGGRQEDGLTRIVDSAEAVGAQVVFVDMPAMDTLLAGTLPHGEADLQRYRTWLEGFAAERGIPVLDMPELVDREILFADLYHLNDDGTRLATRLIGEWLAEIDVVVEPGGVGCGG